MELVQFLHELDARTKSTLLIVILLEIVVLIVVFDRLPNIDRRISTLNYNYLHNSNEIRNIYNILADHEDKLKERTIKAVEVS